MIVQLNAIQEKIEELLSSSHAMLIAFTVLEILK